MPHGLLEVGIGAGVSKLVFPELKLWDPEGIMSTKVIFIPEDTTSSKNIESNIPNTNSIEDQPETMDMNDWDAKVNQLAYLFNTVWKCRNCSYQHPRKGFVMNHIENDHAPEGFPGYKCSTCSAVVHSRMPFIDHRKKCRRTDYSTTFDLYRNENMG